MMLNSPSKDSSSTTPAKEPSSQKSDARTSGSSLTPMRDPYKRKK